MVGGLEDARIAAQDGLVLDLEVLGHRHHDVAGALALDRVVPVGHVLADRDRRERRRVDLVGDRVQDRGGVEDRQPGRRAGRDDPDADREDEDERQADARRAADRAVTGSAAAGREPCREPAQLVRGGLRLGQEPLEDRPDRADRDEAGEEGDLRPELVRLRGDEDRARDRDEDAEDDPPDATGRDGLRVRDHEEQEDQDLRRGHDHAPEVDPADGAERPVRGHAVAGARQQADPRDERQPERRRQAEELQAPGDQQPAADDHRVGDDEPDVERAPPEVERLDPLAAEDEERDDEADVRRVEDVRAAVLDRRTSSGATGPRRPRRPTSRPCSTAGPAACR